MNDGVGEQIAKNNIIFREANEHIRARAAEFEAPLERIPFLCECPRENCTELVPLSLAEYSSIRQNASHFFALAEHASAERPVGHVIAEEDGYVIVEKDLSGSGP